jgi:hypothetical protein
MMSTQITVYDELAEFLATLSPSKVLSFKPSASKQQRLNYLLELKHAGSLTDLEKVELEHYFNLERIIRLAKAHALTLVEDESLHS